MKFNFNLSSFFGSRDVLGIDIGSYSIKLVQLEKTSAGKFSLSKWSILNLPEELISQEANPQEKKSVCVSLLKNYLSREKISTKNVVSSVSGSSVIVRYVKFPKISKNDLGKSIQFEAEPYIPFDIKEVNLGFHILSDIIEEGQKKTDTVLVAAKKDIVQSKIDILQEAGLNPIVIDVDAFALESSYEINKDPEIQEMTIMVNIGANVTNMTILENGISRVVRDIFIGGNTFTKTIQKNLQIDFKVAEELKTKFGFLVTAEDKELALKEDNKDALQVSSILSPIARDLLGEVRRSIDFFYSQRGEQQVISKVLLCGGTALMKNLTKYFSNELKLPTELFDPIQKVEKPAIDIPIEDSTKLAIAVGLATRQANEKS